MHHAVLASLPNSARAILRVTGDDALRFLQGLLTADRELLRGWLAGKKIKVRGDGPATASAVNR